MHIQREEDAAVVITLEAQEAGYIVDDLLSKGPQAGPAAVALATLLREAGFYAKPVVTTRTEWVDPES